MKVILTSDVPKIGKKGALIEVAEGYARNFLFPRKLAVEATEGNIKNLMMEQARQAEKARQATEEAKRLAAKMEGLIVRLEAKAGESGRLFGAVTAQDIATALAKQHQITIDKRKIEIAQPIKVVGDFQVRAKLHPEAEATFRVIVHAAP